MDVLPHHLGRPLRCRGAGSRRCIGALSLVIENFFVEKWKSLKGWRWDQVNFVVHLLWPAVSSPAALVRYKTASFDLFPPFVDAILGTKPYLGTRGTLENVVGPVIQVLLLLPSAPPQLDKLAVRTDTRRRLICRVQFEVTHPYSTDLDRTRSDCNHFARGANVVALVCRPRLSRAGSPFYKVGN